MRGYERKEIKSNRIKSKEQREKKEKKITSSLDGIITTNLHTHTPILSPSDFPYFHLHTRKLCFESCILIRRIDRNQVQMCCSVPCVLITFCPAYNQGSTGTGLLCFPDWLTGWLTLDEGGQAAVCMYASITSLQVTATTSSLRILSPSFLSSATALMFSPAVSVHLCVQAVSA